MTSPNQPYPEWMQAIGQGAYEMGGTGGGAGGSTGYGQSITTSQVNSLIQGPATALTNLDAVSAVTDVVTMVENYLKTMPLQGLQLFQGFLPGTTAADFVDVPTSIATITSKLGLGNLSSTSADSARLMHDATILFDVFHITYEAGTSGDAPGTLGSNGQPTWYSAWNDVLAYISKVFGIPLTAPAPTIGPAITAAGTSGANGSSWSTRLTNDLTILLDVFHLTYTSTQWTNAWTDLLALFGIVNSTSTPSNPAPTIGPSITAAQASATTATTNAATAQTTANTGVANAATAQTKATTASTWATRLTNNLLVISDLFHLTYAAGSSGDAPGTVWSGGGIGNGKLTWYSCWNDLLGLAGTVNSTSAPSDAAPTTGTVIQANTASANTASTNASIAIANAGAANTLAQGTVDGLYQAFYGGTSTGNAVSTVKAGAVAIPASNIVGQTGAAVVFGASGAAGQVRPATTSGSVSWTHTIATGDLGVLVILAWDGVSSGYTSSVTYGGTAMTLLQSQQSAANAGGVAYLQFWWLKSPASGTQTVSATVTGSSGTIQFLGGNSESYSASKVGAVNFAIGSGTTPAVSVSSSVGPMVVASIVTNVGGTLTAFNKTQRYNFTNAAPNGGSFTMLIGDAAGASSVAFSATSQLSCPWVAIAVELTN